jgi:multidrug efflux pump subunit AcrB
MSILILVMGILAIFGTPTDIFPNINIPVVSIIWNYNGLVPKDMNDRIIYVTERALTTTVDNIEHIESQSLYGVAVVKVFFQPTANVDRGIAQITAVSQTQLRQLPAGTTPPLILAYSASSVPVLQLALSGQGLSEQQLNDYGLNFIRTQLITVPGASVPYPYGGKQRQVQVDLNPALQSKGLSALDVVNAISLQNLILPTGTSKIGGKEYDVDVPNAAPQSIDELNRIPIKTVGGSTIYVRDVAWVRDGFPPQTNIVRVNGQRSVLLTIQKAGDASTLKVIGGIKAMLPQIASTVTPQLKMSLAQITRDRYQGLLSKHAVSQQNADNATGTYNANKAIVDTDRASMQRYQALVDFEKVFGPFDEVITARNMDIGDLINAGSNTVADADRAGARNV